MSYVYETKSELYAKFLAAAAKGDLKEVEACRNRGADPNEARDNDRRTALHLAAMNGHADIVKYFLEDHTDARLLDEDENTPLMLAVKNNDAAVVQAYLDCGVSVDAEGYWAEVTPLTVCAASDADEAMKLVLKGDVKAGRADQSGKTAIMWAAQHDSVKAFDVLVEAGADPLAKTNAGKTALDFAKAANATNMLARLESVFPEHGAEMAARRDELAQIAHTIATVQSMTEGLQDRMGVLRPLKLKSPS